MLAPSNSAIIFQGLCFQLFRNRYQPRDMGNSLSKERATPMPSVLGLQKFDVSRLVGWLVGRRSYL